jgi:hypothetical protein
MYQVKLNSNKKLALYKSDSRKTDFFDNIIEISQNYYVLINANNFDLDYFFYKKDEEAITHKFLNKYIESFNKKYFIITENDFFFVYSKDNIEVIFKQKIGKSKYNFVYLGDFFTIADDSLYDNGFDLGNFQEQEVLYSSNNKKLIKFKDFLIWDKSILIKKEFEHEIEKIYDNYPKRDLLILHSEKTTTIYLNSKKIFSDKIDFNTFEIGNQNLRVFVSKNNTYILGDKLYGPFNFNIDKSLNAIYKSKDCDAYLNNGFLLIHDKIKDEITDKKSDILDFKKVTNSNLIYKYDDISLCEENSKLYYYNKHDKNLRELIKLKSLRPIVADGKLFYLDENYEEKIFNFSYPEAVIVDYTFYDNIFLIIFKLLDEYFLYNQNTGLAVKKFKKPISSTFNRNCLFQIDPVPGKKIELLYLSKDRTKLEKLPLKANSIDKSLMTGDVIIDFETDSAMPQIFLTSDFSIIDSD